MRKLLWRVILAALSAMLLWAPFAAAQQPQTMTTGGFTYELNTDRRPARITAAPRA